MREYKSVPEIPDSKLSQWWEQDRNVLIIGDHGIGKTAIIRNFWEKLGIKYAIFSGATLDPWTDLIGIPRPIEKDGKMVIEYIRPQTLPDNVEAIYIDEINRSHPKVRNALLELLQFKSINGRRFPNLRVIWAAANPPDTEFNYDVEELDPAQEDRFHVIVKLGRNLNKGYFIEKFGEKLANAAMGWWVRQNDETQALVSPRRLDYILETYSAGGDIKDVVPYKLVNIVSLKKALSSNDKMRDFYKLFEKRDNKGAKKFLSKASNWQNVYREVVADYDLSLFAIRNLHAEYIAATASSNYKFAMVLAHAQKGNKEIRSLIREIKDSCEDHEWLSTALLALNHLSIGDYAANYFDNINGDSLAKREKVGNLLQRIGNDSFEDVMLSLFKNSEKPFPLYDIDSAIEIFKFIDTCNQLGDINWDNMERVKKAVFGAVYTVYLKYGNLFPIAFYTSVEFVQRTLLPFLAKEFSKKGEKNKTPVLQPAVPIRGGRRDSNSMQPVEL